MTAAEDREALAEALAAEFHAAYERLAPHYGYRTRDASRVRWEDVPEDNKSLMIATAEQVLDGPTVDTIARRRAAEELRAAADRADEDFDGLGVSVYLLRDRADDLEAT